MNYNEEMALIDLFDDYSQWETAGEDTQYRIKFNEDTKEAIVAFYGSNSKSDWIADLSFWKKPYKRMSTTFYVHAGFLKRWKVARDTVIDKLESLEPKSITVVGHSYGGAVALLCMEDCWFRFIHSREGKEDSLKGKIRCITFGAPRILGIYNYKKIKERWEGTTEYFNGSDIITCVPPKYFLYRHPVKRTHIGEKYSFSKMLFHSKDYHSIWRYRDTFEKESES